MSDFEELLKRVEGKGMPSAGQPGNQGTPRMSKKKSPGIKVHLPKMLNVCLLTEHPSNSQRQSKHEFAKLRESIVENGFDETLLVRPIDGGMYEVVAGNHRFRAGAAEGMQEFPCVVRDDWDAIKAELESVKRNYVRGKIDKKAFTSQVDQLMATANLPIDVIYEQMGFQDADAFSKLYEKEREIQAEVADAIAAASTSAGAVKIIDDLGNILSGILAQYGHTVPNSFIVFPAGGKLHLYVAATPALKNILSAIAEAAVAQGLDINIALGGLLTIGAQATDFLKGNGGVEVNELGRAEGDGTTDIEPIGMKRND